MIITNIIGGIGNQLFQYYFGRKIATINNTSLKLENSDFANYNWHEFELNKFNLKYEIASKKEIEIFLNENLIAKAIQKLSPYYKRKLVKQRVDFYDSNLLKIKDNSYLNQIHIPKTFFIYFKKYYLSFP